MCEQSSMESPQKRPAAHVKRAKVAKKAKPDAPQPVEVPVAARRAQVLVAAQAVAEKPIPRGTLKIAKKPAASTANTETKELPGLGKTKASHFTNSSYIQHLIDGRWKCLCYSGDQNKQEIIDEIWTCMCKQTKPMSYAMIQAKKQALSKVGHDEQELNGEKQEQ